MPSKKKKKAGKVKGKVMKSGYVIPAKKKK